MPSGTPHTKRPITVVPFYMAIKTSSGPLLLCRTQSFANTPQSWLRKSGPAADVCVVDTPGLQDINQIFVSRANQFIDNADIFVYLINANGGITEGVKTDIDLLKATERPLLVLLNKIDTIDQQKRDEFIAHQSSRAGVPDQDFRAVAFNPLPVVSPHPINLDTVRKWLDITVKEQGEKLLDLKRSSQESKEPDEKLGKVLGTAFGHPFYEKEMSDLQIRLVTAHAASALTRGLLDSIW